MPVKRNEMSEWQLFYFTISNNSMHDVFAFNLFAALTAWHRNKSWGIMYLLTSNSWHSKFTLAALVFLETFGHISHFLNFKDTKVGWELVQQYFKKFDKRILFCLDTCIEHQIGTEAVTRGIRMILLKASGNYKLFPTEGINCSGSKL